MSIDTLLSGLTTSQKLEAMDFLWRDLSRTASEFQSPAWHETGLAERMRNPSSEPSIPLEDAITNARERLNERRTKE